MSDRYLVDNICPSYEQAYRYVKWIKDTLQNDGFLTERRLKHDLALLGMGKEGFGWEETDISSIKIERKNNSSSYKVTMNNPHKLTY